MSGAIGLTLPSAAAAAGQAYQARVTACDGDLVEVPASAFTSTFAPYGPMPDEGPGDWYTDSESVTFVAGSTWTPQSDLGGLINEHGTVRYQIPASLDMSSIDSIRLAMMRVLQVSENGAWVFVQAVTITRGTDCDEEPPTSSSEPFGQRPVVGAAVDRVAVVGVAVVGAAVDRAAVDRAAVVDD